MKVKKIFLVGAGLMIGQGWLTFCTAEELGVGGGVANGPCPADRRHDRIPGGELQTWLDRLKFRMYAVNSNDLLPQVPEEDMEIYYEPFGVGVTADCFITIFRITSTSIAHKPSTFINGKPPMPHRTVADRSCICVNLPQAAWCWEGDVLVYEPSCR
jgi:hypothetical protein